MTVDTVTTEGPWESIAGSRFATPDEWLPVVTEHFRRHPHLGVLAQAFAAAANADGRLLDHHPVRLYERHVSDVLRDEDDDPGWRLTYDRFVAQVVLGAEAILLLEGYLAQRHVGDREDCRLTLPAAATEKKTATSRGTIPGTLVP